MGCVVPKGDQRDSRRTRAGGFDDIRSPQPKKGAAQGKKKHGGQKKKRKAGAQHGAAREAMPKAGPEKLPTPTRRKSRTKKRHVRFAPSQRGSVAPAPCLGELSAPPGPVYRGPGMCATDFAVHSVAEVVPLTATARRYRIALLKGCTDVPDFPACSHVSVKDPDSGQIRPYTPTRVGAGFFELVVESRYPGGVVSGHFARLSAGAPVLVKGPRVGEWEYMTCSAPCLLLLAGGTGVAPMYQVLRHLICWRDHAERGDDSRPRKALLLMSARTVPDLLIGAELDALRKRHPGWVDVHFFVTQHDPREPLRAPPGVSASVTAGRIDGAAVRRCLSASCIEVREAHCLHCGPEPFDEAMDAVLKELGVPEDRISCL
eukprot:TRINITY_DN47076_c0_g1_i1.p1 TRINITY_DN47076_c0_g1~~TRINITY_DN47076_c0_g1_i1.p1  ORF type:complete len:405 (+),score=76.65 TRINITY_DN47076_c0_g1_i1:96-1217(+)